MAKRKNAAALFEVIHSDKRARLPRTGITWPSIGAWLRKRGQQRSSDSAASAAPSQSSQQSRVWSFLPPMPKWALDPDRQVVSFKLTYTTALVGAFSLLAIVTLAFVIGRHLTRPSVPTLADATTDELREGPAQPEVLDVGPESSPPAMAAAPLPSGNAPAAPRTGTAQGARPAWSDPKPPTTYVDVNQKRAVNLQYVIVQSYPPQEKQMAQDACDLLNKRGILCTVETGLSYAPNWYVVVGVIGFDRVRNSPEYDAYVQRIEQISREFAGTSKFKKFEPRAFKWKEPTKTQ